ncbi:MAG TPA: fluoride efflux transporter CrcB [Solirubrobacterales bacterium]|nr:fluoride efflux transporter CrcB [Solirubrobacterales bacterium]
MIDRRELGAIFLGGALGTLVRAGVVEALGHGAPEWPWATFLVNVAGAFLLGWFVIGLPEKSHRRPLLMAGFCGSLTTFSTLQLELLEMLDAGRVGLAGLYGMGSVVAGYLGVVCAMATARRWRLR